MAIYPGQTAFQKQGIKPEFWPIVRNAFKRNNFLPAFGKSDANL